MKLKYEVEIVDIDGSPMGVPIDSGDEFRGVLQMNGTARDILETLKTDVTEDEIVSALLEKYDAPEADLRSSVQKVLSVLREYSLLVE